MNLNKMTVDQLTEHITEAMTVLRRKAYGEGYKQGKFDAEMDGLIRKYGGGETAQEARDRIVEQAKNDIEEIKKYLGLSYVQFVINKEKRTIVALIKRVPSRNVESKGKAKCNPDDCFNVHIGKVIALRRALGLEVPDEYLNAPQPTEVRVGDVVKNTRHNYVKTVVKIQGNEMYYNDREYDFTYFINDERMKIIDDSREDVTNK